MKLLFCLRESGTDNPVTRRRVPEERGQSGTDNPVTRCRVPEEGPQLFIYENSQLPDLRRTLIFP